MLPEWQSIMLPSVSNRGILLDIVTFFEYAKHENNKRRVRSTEPIILGMVNVM